MKITFVKSAVLGMGLLGIGSAFGLTDAANAAPRNRDVKQERRDVKEARKDVKQEKRELKQAQKQTGNRYPVRPGIGNNRPGSTYRPGVGNRPVYRPGVIRRPNTGGVYNDGGYTGTVTRVRSNQSFDVNIGGKTFNVYLTGYAPRGLSTRDIVRVTGVRQDSNDIRNARVSIIRNG